MISINGNQYDFIDFGASKGGCIDFAKQRLAGTNGLGIDISRDKVDLMRRNGYECILGDITNLANIPDNSVRFVTMSHVLEHLPNIEAIKDAIAEAARISTDFLFMQGPFFDADEYLLRKGFKFFWSSWRGHTYHLTTNILGGVLEEYNFRPFEIFVRLPVTSSEDQSIHPISSPVDQHEYNEKTHPYKKIIEFNVPVYKEIVCYVRLKEFAEWKDILLARKGCCRLLS